MVIVMTMKKTMMSSGEENNKIYTYIDVDGVV